MFFAILILVGSLPFIAFARSVVLVIRAENKLREWYPAESAAILGNRRVESINRKMGILFLWDPQIREIERRDANISISNGDARKGIRNVPLVFVGSVVAMIITWYMFAKLSLQAP